jgi:hypothetical protein
MKEPKFNQMKFATNAIIVSNPVAAFELTGLNSLPSRKWRSF